MKRQKTVEAYTYQGLGTFYVSCLGCGARTDLEYAEEFAADLWNERVSYVD